MRRDAPGAPRGCHARRISSDKRTKREQKLNGPRRERATLPASADRVTVAARRVAAARTQVRPTFTSVFSIPRRSYGQPAPSVEAESKNSSEYSHVIKMDTLTRRSCCAGAPRDCNRGSQRRPHGCSRRSAAAIAAPLRGVILRRRRDVTFELARFLQLMAALGGESRSVSAH